MKNVDLRLLECFEALVRECNVTIAAERLNMSQGNMSNSLARLRELLGDPILVRTAQGMVPTAKAVKMRARVQKLILELEDLLDQSQSEDILKVQRKIKIACGDAMALLVLGPLIAKIAVAAPNLQLDIAQVANFRVKEPLGDGSFDLAIGVYPDLADSLLISRLLSGRMVAVVNPQSEYVRTGIDLDAYCSAPHGVFSAGTGFRATVELETDRALASLGRSRTVRLTSQYGSLILNAVAQSDLIATCPDFMSRLFAEQSSLAMVELPFCVPDCDVSMVWHHRLKDDAVLRWVRDALRNSLL